MSTPTVRVTIRTARCHYVDADKPDWSGEAVTVCGSVFSWRSTKLGFPSDVDCIACVREVQRRLMVEEVGS